MNCDSFAIICWNSTLRNKVKGLKIVWIHKWKILYDLPHSVVPSARLLKGYCVSCSSMVYIGTGVHLFLSCQCTLTVCAAALSGVRWTGVRLLFLLSHRTICPEYVPPITRFGWNLAKQEDITEDCKWKIFTSKNHNQTTNVHVLVLHSSKYLLVDLHTSVNRFPNTKHSRVAQWFPTRWLQEGEMGREVQNVHCFGAMLPNSATGVLLGSTNEFFLLTFQTVAGRSLLVWYQAGGVPRSIAS